jgi:hypothetical protein
MLSLMLLFFDVFCVVVVLPCYRRCIVDCLLLE